MNGLNDATYNIVSKNDGEDHDVKICLDMMMPCVFVQ